MLYTALAMFWRYITKAYAVGGTFGADMPTTLRPVFGNVGASGIFNPKATILLGMLSTAYMAHFNAPKFFVELKDNTVPRFMTVVGTSFGIAVALFASMAAMGFLTFGGNCAGLILSNYSPKDTLMNISRIAVALAITFSYPLAFVGFRDGVLDLLKIKERKPILMNGLTTGLLSFVTFMALVIPDVSFVLSFAGSTLGNALVYIFPAIMFRGAIKKLPNPTKLQKVEVKLAMGSALFGIVVGSIGAVKAVQAIL
jgi:amino acid permease